jgi:hypothetical protein
MVTAKKTAQSVELPAEGDRGLGEQEAARTLGVSVALLRFWRWKKIGPRFRKIGRRVVYVRSDLFSFLQKMPAGGGKAA